MNDDSVIGYIPHRHSPVCEALTTCEGLDKPIRLSDLDVDTQDILVNWKGRHDFFCKRIAELEAQLDKAGEIIETAWYRIRDDDDIARDLIDLQEWLEAMK